MSSTPSVTSAKQWKKATTAEEVKLPSGNVCLARRPGIQEFMSKGVIPDELTAIVRKGLAGSDAAIEKAMQDAASDLSKLTEFFEMVDHVTCSIVVEPKVLPKPDEGEARDPEQLYVDEVDMEDKVFLFNFAVGGTRDVATFREQSQELVASARLGEAVPVSSE